MVTIEVNNDAPGPEEMAMVLEQIAKQLRQGFTAGQYWSLHGEEELPEEDDMDDDSDKEEVED